MQPPPLLESLWQRPGCRPNDQQAEAILHGDGPLFLPAGPGSGKTRVLLWRVVHLLAVRDVPVERIFVATFTEKAARQLRDGLRKLLGLVTHSTRQSFDTAQLSVGTVHSLCHRLIHDRSRSATETPPTLIDELGQYLLLRRKRVWQELARAAGGDGWDNTWINSIFGSESRSRHVAITNCLAFFNRLSDEGFDGEDWERRFSLREKSAARKLNDEDEAPFRGAKSDNFGKLLAMYAAYRKLLTKEHFVDFATLQQEALAVAGEPDLEFEHVIVDEYQDTNAIQERLFFRLASAHRNLCVVGDDDQALYRFRGATVENLVEFPARCRNNLGVEPRTIVLATNYRSRKSIVEFSSRFMSQCDWRSGGLFQEARSHRIEGKQLSAYRDDDGPAVFASAPAAPDQVYREIAAFARRLIDKHVVANANQIAFLFPSLKSKRVALMQQALTEAGLSVYAPRAGTFLEVDEAKWMFGLLLNILGKPERGSERSRKYGEFLEWMDAACAFAAELASGDVDLATYIQQRKGEVARAAADFRNLREIARKNGWDVASAYESNQVAQALADMELSTTTTATLHSPQFQRLVQSRRARARPVSLRYAFNQATALPWTVLDVFHELCGLGPFRQIFAQAEERHEDSTPDEGPLCNLALTSQYLGRFVEEFHWLLTGERLATGWYAGALGGFLYHLFRREEPEYEDADDPFPSGRIPFLTVHQAKGLEFPVVVLANPSKTERLQPLERLVQPLLDRDGEPIERQGKFDAMRLFYVALTRARNLVVLPDYQGRGQTISAPFTSLVPRLPRIGDLDLATVPAAGAVERDLPRSFSYTGDYAAYRQCPRHYYVFHAREFVPARSQPMHFGRLVHQTICDLHRELIAQRDEGPASPHVNDDSLRQLFGAAHERLQTEIGGPLLSAVREVAWRQVQMYWRKLPHIALAVTDPEVRLHLPDQQTPQGRRYAIEGVVDVVADDDGATLYEIKTCDVEDVHANMELHRAQLAVYAHVWNGLHPTRPVQQAAIISTALPDAVEESIYLSDENGVSQSLAAWNPVAPVPLSSADIHATLDDFSRVVDLIEDGRFPPPTPAELARRTGGRTFAERICGNCDARFSCPSYQEYTASRHADKDSAWRHMHPKPKAWRRDAGLSDDDSPREELA